MAEFCLDCMNKYDVEGEEKLTRSDVIVENDFCEGCGEWKECVIKVKRKAIHKVFGEAPYKWYQFWRK